MYGRAILFFKERVVMKMDVGNIGNIGNIGKINHRGTLHVMNGTAIAHGIY